MSTKTNPFTAEIAANPVYRALEPRIAFDAALAATVDQAVSHPVADAHADAAAHPTAETLTLGAVRALTQAISAAEVAHAADPAPAPATGDASAVISAIAERTATAPPSAGANIVFIDAAVTDPAAIIAAIPKGAEIVMLDATHDGLDQIATYLAGRTNVGAIQIISHGAVGELRLGNATIKQADLATHQADLAVIGGALATGGDILLYGCDIAQGSAGHAFISEIAARTGDDVAASTGITGSAALGGNWVLEDHVGDIQTAAIDARNWDHELAPLTISVVHDPIQTGGTNAGAVGLWTNAGTIGSEAIDIRATVVSADAGVTINFATRTGFYDAAQTLKADDMWVQISGGNATVKWEIFKSGTNQTVKAVGDPNFRITDIDGYGGPVPAAPTIEVEAVAPDLHGLTSYVVGSPTNLNVTIINGEVLVRGTQNQNSEPTSLVGFNWTQVSSWQVTYSAAPGYGTRFFYHDGNGDFQFVSPQTTYMLQLDADADNSTAAGTSSTTTYTENGSAVRVVDTDVLIAQQAVLGTSLQTATVDLTNAQPGDELLVNGSNATSGSIVAGASTLSYTTTTAGGHITVTLTGAATPSDYQSALKAITFDNTTNNPGSTDRLIETTVTNTTYGTSSNIALSTIHVTPVNDAPVEVVPGALTTSANTALPLTGLSVSDVDANGGLETVTLTVAHGTLTLGAKTGLVFTTGDGMADISMVFKGSLADINAALASLSYTPAGNYAGVDTLSFTTNDSGNTGTGGGLSSGTQTVAITVTPAPPVAASDVFYTTQATAIAVAVLANDSDPQSFALTVSEIDGHAIAAGDPAGVAVTGGTVTLDATGKLTYTPDAGYVGTPSFTYTIDDGHGLTSTATVHGSVTPLNHAPVNIVPAAQAAIGSAVTFSIANGNAVQVTDDASATQIIQTTVSVDTGTLTLAQTAGLTFVKGDGTTDAVITMQGTKAAINAALDGLTFSTSAGATGTAHLTITTDDLGNPNGEDIPNGSFETTLTAVANNSFKILNQSQVPGWSTTATDHMIEIWGTGFLGVPAYEGSHFAELNANQVAADFNTSTIPKGQPLTFSFAHRGRAGVDVMNVQVVDAGADGVFGTADDATLMNQNYSDGTSAWGVYQKDLGTATGNPVRLIFNSVSSTGGSSIGNFLDAVHLGTAHLTDTATVAINLNTQPLIDLNSAASAADTARNNAIIFVQGASALKVAAVAADVNDLGERDITKLSIVAGAVKDGAAEVITVAGQAFPANADKVVTAVVGGTSVKIAYVAATGTFSVTNAANATMPMAQADLDTLVGSITYADNSPTPTAGDRTLTFTATDAGGLSSPAAVATITVLPLHEAPHLDLSGNAAYTVPGIGTGAFLYGHQQALPADRANASYSTASNVIAVANPEAGGSGLSISYGTGTHADITGIASTNFADAVNGNAYISMSFTTSASLVESWITHVTKLNAGGPNYQFAVAISTDGFQTATLLSEDNPSPSNGSPDSYASGYPNFNGTDFKLAAGTTYEIRAYIYNVAGGAAATINWDDFYVFFHNDSPDYATTFTENGAAVSIAAPPVAIEDVNDTSMAGGAVTLTNKQASDQLLIGGNLIASGSSTTIGGITYAVTETAGTTVIALSGTATRSAYAAALKGITFQNTSDAPVTTDRVITATVTDGVETSNIATTTIHVIPVNDAPVAADKTITTLEDTAVTLTTATFGFADPKDSPANALANVIIDSVPASGMLTLNGTAVTAGQSVSAADIAAGKLVYTPDANANGAGLASFTFQVQDSGGTANGGVDTSVTANTITFNVTPVNDAPVAANDTGNVDRGQPTRIPVIANDSDVDNDPLTVVLAKAEHGTVTINPDGTITYTPAWGYEGSDVIRYRISDGNGGFADAIVRLNVTADAAARLPDALVPGAVQKSETPPREMVTGMILDAVSATTATGSAGRPPVAGVVVDAVRDLTREIDVSAANSTSFDTTGSSSFSFEFSSTASDPVVAIETYLRKNVLVVQLGMPGLMDRDAAVEWKVQRADGRPRPDWLNFSNRSQLKGERAANDEVMDLRITAILPDGTTVSRDVRIIAPTGEMLPLRLGRQSQMLPFWEQIHVEPLMKQAEIEELGRFLMAAA